MPKWPVTGPSEYWLLVSNPATAQISNVISEFVSDELESNRRKWLWPVSPNSLQIFLQSLGTNTKTIGQKNRSLCYTWKRHAARAPKTDHATLKKSNQMQQYEDIYLLLSKSTCFGRPSRPSSGVHKTVVAASCTDHTIWGASFFKRDQIRIILIWSRLKKLAPQIVWYLPESANTVLCTPDNGRDGCSKHVE